MKITQENNETVVHFGRILTEKEKALMEICLAFFQAAGFSNNSINTEKPLEESDALLPNG